MNDENQNSEEISLNAESNDKSNKELITLSSPENAKDILDTISKGNNVELDINKQDLLNKFNTFMLAEAYSQLPTIMKLHELQTKCLDAYYKQVNELLEEDDANVFMLDKIISTINNSIDRCNNIILKLGLNSDITDQLMINHIDNSQTLYVYQSQISKQKVLDTISAILQGEVSIDVDAVDVNDINTSEKTESI